MADRRWIDAITQIVSDTWDEAHPQQPKTHGYMGSEEFIRLQFEEYLLALLSCMKYHEELNSFLADEPSRRSRAHLDSYNIDGNPALEFNQEFLAQWKGTSNYALFERLTSDALLFSVAEPRHPSAGGLTIDDVQRRISQQVADLHLDEKVREGREALNRHLSTGQKKVSAAFNSFWADIESMREAQRKRNEEKASQSPRPSLDRSASLPVSPSDSASSTAGFSWFPNRKAPAPAVDMTQAQASVSVGQKAGAYFSSWGSWATEKKKEWQEKKSTSPSPTESAAVTSPSTPTLASITESNDNTDKGRRLSMQSLRSEGSNTLSRSGSRRKRLSNIFLKRDSLDINAANRDNDDNETVYPKSPLSREAPGLGDDYVSEPSTKQTESEQKAAATIPEEKENTVQSAPSDNTKQEEEEPSAAAAKPTETTSAVKPDTEAEVSPEKPSALTSTPANGSTS